MLRKRQLIARHRRRELARDREALLSHANGSRLADNVPLPIPAEINARLVVHRLRLREAGMIKSSPNRIISDGTDWRILNELKRELKG
jgi:hypothetical protein